MMEKTILDRATVSQILPDEVWVVLEALGRDASHNAWTLGDLFCEIADESPYPKWMVDAACAAVTGLSNSRVRDIRVTAAFYPERACCHCGSLLDLSGYCRVCEQASIGVRDAFEVCSFSHFETAKRAGSFAEAVKWLKRVVESADDYGGLIMPVSKLQALMAGEIEATPVYEKRVRQIGSNASKLSADPDAPEVYRQVAMEVLALLKMRKVYEED
ncbi:hypothetical protein D6833_13875 [Candidatus Parcubacteria bacterium]|nr:MAG: hypothetical protein D6833_13875 [Candidatus Parcubacteria bacterium]